MTGQTTEVWMEFCQLAANRAAAGKLIALANEINRRLEEHTSVFENQHVRLPECAECEEAVVLETAVTDEDGRAIHADCYLLRLRLKRYARPGWQSNG
ncbi:MAG: hypothetical protein WA718_01435 [Terriglobales bacterium]